MSEYVPSPWQFVADQVEKYESSGGTEGLTLMDTGLPVIFVTNKGRKTGATRKTPLMRAVEGDNYILYDGACGADVVYHLVAEERLLELAKQQSKDVSIHLFGQEVNAETYAITKADLLLKREGDEAENFVLNSTLLWSVLKNSGLLCSELLPGTDSWPPRTG